MSDDMMDPTPKPDAAQESSLSYSDVLSENLGLKSHQQSELARDQLRLELEDTIGLLKCSIEALQFIPDEDLSNRQLAKLLPVQVVHEELDSYLESVKALEDASDAPLSPKNDALLAFQEVGSTLLELRESILSNSTVPSELLEDTLNRWFERSRAFIESAGDACSEHRAQSE